MLRPRHLRPANRRAVILLVVITLLALFAIVGLTFVLYSESQATASRIFREAEAPSRSEIDPEMLGSFFLGQLLYDVDDLHGVHSSLRGHSLSRLMFGAPDTVTFPGIPSGANLFNGTGRLRGVAPNGPGVDEYNLVNYMYFQSDGRLHDPERLGWRTNAASLAARGPYTGGFNVPYTFPDLNNMFLGAMRASDGKVLIQSYHRPWMFGPLAQSNPNWTSPQGKYMTLRPRPIDHSPAFPYPEDEGGDVKNLLGCPGYTDGRRTYNNDSIWIDLGFPVKIGPDGRKYKPLFAPLIIDMDSRINLNVVGNIRGRQAGQPVHTSNQGWGPWEINPARLTPSMPGTEWNNLFLGNSSVPAMVNRGRYGRNQQPQNPGSATAWRGTPHFYSKIDYDGCNETGAPANGFSAKIPHPLTGNNCFPNYPNNSGYGNASATERLNHPLRYNPYAPVLGNGPGGDDRVLGTNPANRLHLAHMEALLRYDDTGSPALTSELFQLMPQTMTDAKVRRMVTLLSFDPDQPSLHPWGVCPDTNPPPGAWASYYKPYQLNVGAGNPPYPKGDAIPFPAQSLRSTTLPPNSEFDNNWRATTKGIGQGSLKGVFAGPPATNSSRLNLTRFDLNQPLPPFPTVQPNANGAYPQNLYDQARSAIESRQQMAEDIFQRLHAVTIAGRFKSVADPHPPAVTPGMPEYDAVRWLAQLAVNIVDYIDDDDVITPFKWQPNPTGNSPEEQIRNSWVYGTELPRLVLNEAYSEAINDPDDQDAKDPKMPTAKKDFRVNFWVELHNPMYDDTTLSENGKARLYATLQTQQGAMNWGGYAIVIGDKNDIADIRKPQNVRGELDNGKKSKLMVIDYAPAQGKTPKAGVDTKVVLPANGSANSPVQENRGYYVLGPKYDFPGANPFATLQIQDPTDSNPNPQKPYEPARPLLDPMLITPPPPAPAAGAPTSQCKTYYDQYGIRNDMSYKLPTAANPVMPEHAVLLQRLCCPYMPCQPDPAQPYYNPYVTVDYIESVRTYDAIDATTSGKNMNKTTVDQRKATGKEQPYTSEKTKVKDQTGGGANQPKNSLFNVNQPRDQVFDWLVHLDRQLISATEILHASAYKPHELTQQFISNDPNRNPPVKKFDHRAPWNDEQARLYRVFEFLTTHTRVEGGLNTGAVGRTTIRDVYEKGGNTYEIVPDGRPPRMMGRTPSGTLWLIEAGTRVLVGTNPSSQEWVVATAATKTSFTATFIRPPAPGTQLQISTMADRVPGRINLNTVWDPEILQALCDPQSSNYFTNNHVSNIFNNILSTRSPNYNNGNGPAFGSNDRPFRGMAQGLSPQGGDPQYTGPAYTSAPAGIFDTFFRVDPSDNSNPPTDRRRIFGINNPQQGGDHPYLKDQLLNKIYNNLTPRSSVFAVWCTVGFFEVVDDSTRPVKLGAEIGKAEGRNIRHRFFSIVDRSVYTEGREQNQEFPGNTYGATPATPGSVWVTPGRPSGNPMENIHVGSQLRIVGQAVNANLTAQQTGPNTFTANFPQRMAAPFTVRVTVQVPVQVGVDPVTGQPIIQMQPRTFTTNATTPVTTPGQQTPPGVTVADPNWLQWLGQNPNISASSPQRTETVYVTAVQPDPGVPTMFQATFANPYNPGPNSFRIFPLIFDQARIGSSPGFQPLFNVHLTWDAATDPIGPVQHFSVID